MLTFSLVPDESNNHYQILIDPDLIESVAEGRTRPPGYGGFIDTCILAMASGVQHTVIDHKRDVFKRIQEAQSRNGDMREFQREYTDHVSN